MKAIVLAGGKGTRLNSASENIPKVLRKLDKMCLIDSCLKSIDIIEKKDTVIVVGFQKEKVIEHLGPHYTYVVQEKQLGTGHAVLCTREVLEGINDDVLIIYGDMPLVKGETIARLIEKHASLNADMTVLTAVVKNILPYGRIIRDEQGRVVNVVEEKDADEQIKNINELNVGVIVVKIKYLYNALLKIKGSSASGEYYLTDLTRVLAEEGKDIQTYTTYDEDEIRGVNTIEDLNYANNVLKKRNAH